MTRTGPTDPSLPGASVVVFDAVCVLCCAGLHWIVRHDKHAHWRFLPMQSRRGTAALVAAGISPQSPVSFLVLHDGRCYTESQACLVIARDLGGIYEALATAARIVPKTVLDAVYRLVARNRYRWFGRRESCYVPATDEFHRFLAD
jgi:predicted DCC family thiol-disulfide oxidoreductase YuxK